MNALSICNTSIRQFDGLYSLNDLHKASGANKKNQPSNWLRVEQTKELINEINRSSYLRNALISKRGGDFQGTFACKELVYAYAMWISAAFMLQVIRAYDSMANQPADQKRLSNKSDRVPLKDAVNMLAAKSKTLSYSDAYTMIHQRFNIETVESLSVEELPACVEYVHQLVGTWEHAREVEHKPAALTLPKDSIVIDKNLWYNLQGTFEMIQSLWSECESLGGFETARQLQSKPLTAIVSLAHELKVVTHVQGNMLKRAIAAH